MDKKWKYSKKAFKTRFCDECQQKLKPDETMLCEACYRRLMGGA